MVQQLFDEVQKLKEEVRRLKGRQDRVSSGGTLIQTTSGVLLSDNDPTTTTPGDLPDPGVGTRASRDDHEHGNDGGSGTAGQYRQFVYEVSGGTFTFLTDSDGNPIFVLEDLE
jgi:hypothetical protein